MEFVGEFVKHKTFGTGKIEEFNDTFIVVKFEDGEVKDFVFPDAFDSYLKLTNENLSKQVDEKLVIYRKIEEEKKIKEIERREAADRLRLIKAQIESSKKNGNKKVDSNITFKCTYVETGLDSDMEDNSDNNIENNKLLTTWRAFPDKNYVEKNGAKVKDLKNVNQSSLVLLSTTLPTQKEKDRVIFGAFLLKEDYILDYNTRGYLEADKNYRVGLTLEEAKMIKFWDFYFNPKNPEKIVNSSTTYRYFDDIQASQVLKAINEIKKGTPDESVANKILERYCTAKNIDVNKIPEPKGALQRLASSAV